MSVDPEGTPVAGNSPAPEAPEAPQDNWEQRYKDTQAAFTRSQQELAQAQRLMNGEDPDALKAVLDKYGYELADDTEPAADPEPDTAPAIDPALLEQIKEIPNLKAFQEQILAAQAEQQFTDDLTRASDGWEVPDVARDWIAQQTASNGNNYEALQNAVKACKEVFDGYAQANQRRRPRAPHVPAGGTAADGPVDTANMSRSELDRYVMDRLNAEQA